MSGRIKIVTAAALALAACAEKGDGEPVYSPDQCRRVALIDASTGKAVVGAEDLTFDPAMRHVIISAYDRRAVERQAARGAGRLDEGGIYSVPLDVLAGDATSLTVSSIVSRDTVVGGLRPHGVAFDEARREITFVNRSYQKMYGRWRVSPRIERAGADGAVFVGDGGAPRCSANDIALIGDRTFVSFDHGSCGWRAGIEDLAAAKASGIETVDGDTMFDRARHANGVTATPGRQLALASTRDKSIVVLAEEGDGFDVSREIAVPGGPDNLTVSADGSIVAAVYPSLLTIGAQRRLGLGRSGSRIVSANLETGEISLLFNDDKGKFFSAASAGLLAEGLLIMGSALDRGIVVCKPDSLDR